MKKIKKTITLSNSIHREQEVVFLLYFSFSMTPSPVGEKWLCREPKNKEFLLIWSSQKLLCGTTRNYTQ
jgi:hypothetical protein